MIAENKKIYLTKEGFLNTRKEYELIKKIKSSKVKEEMPDNWHKDDIGPEYNIFREELALLEQRQIELENVLDNAVLIKTSKKNKDKITLGAIVKVEARGKCCDEFKIVGSIEADPLTGKISNESPVGRALIGKKVGDIVKIGSSIKTIYEIKDILYST